MWWLIVYSICLLITICFWFRVKSEDSSWKDYTIVIYNAVFLAVMLSFHCSNMYGANGFVNVLKAIFSAASIITFDSGALELTEKLGGCKMLIIVMAPFVTVANVIISAFCQKFLDEKREKIDFELAKEVFVFRGSVEDLKLLTDEVYDPRHKGKKACVVIIPTTPLKETAYFNALVSDDSFFEKKIFSPKDKRYQEKKYHIVLLPDDESRNMEILKIIDRNIKECLIRDGIIPEKETDGNEVDQPQENTKDSNSKQNTKMEDFISRFMVVAFVENDTLRYDTVTYKHMKYKLLSKENTIIGNAICKKPPIQLFIDNNKTEIKDSIICFKKKMYLCLIGFSKLAQEYLLQIFENCYFTIQDNQEWALQVHVYNWKLQEKIQFLDRCPFFKEQEMIEWEKEPFEMGEIYKKSLNKGDCFYDEILIAGNESDANYSCAKDLMRFILMNNVAKDKLVQPRIVLNLYDSDYADAAGEEVGDNNASLKKRNLLTPVFDKYKNYYVLSSKRSVFKYTMLIDWDKEENDAKAYNDIYNDSNERGKEWYELDYFTRMSNYAAVRDFEINKKAMFSSSLDEINKMNDTDREAAFWGLAKNEHLRWMVYHFTRGWTSIRPEELKKTIGYNTGVNKIPEAKKHLLLVPWEMINEVLKKLGRTSELDTILGNDYKPISKYYSDGTLMNESAQTK